MNDIVIAVNFEYESPTVSGRELHAAQTPYHKWFPRMCEYGFAEGINFNLDKNVRVQIEGKRNVSREVIDHRITIDMAKELCMIQRTEIGKRCREYFLEIEKKWNSPEAIMARTLQLADRQLELVKEQNIQLLYQKYAGKGYVKSKTYTVNDENGNPLAKPHTCWTTKGRLFIYELLKQNGILPLIEQNDG